MTDTRGVTRDVELRAPVILVVGVFLLALSGRFDMNVLGSTVGVRFVGAVPVAILTILWMARSAGARRAGTGGAVAGVVVLLGVHLASALWAEPGARTGLFTANALVVLLALYATWSMVRVDPEGTRRAFLVCLFAAACVYALGSAATGASSGIGRSVAFGGGPNVFVRIMVWGVIAALCLWLITRRKALLVPVPVFVVFTVLSGSRGAMLAAAVTGVVLLLLLRRSITGGWLVRGLVAIPALAWFIWTNEQVRFLAEKRFTLENLTATGYSGRSNLWNAAEDLFSRHPFTGNGADAFYALKYSETGLPYAHNLLLELAVDLGLVGLILTAVLAVRVFARLRFLRGTISVSQWAFIAAAAFTFGAAMFSGDIYDSRFLWLFICLACAAPAGATVQDSLSQKENRL